MFTYEKSNVAAGSGITTSSSTVFTPHLESVTVDNLDFVSANEKIGTVGDSGNAKGKPAHVHYSIVTLLPYFWQMTTESQGWKKMFFLDPGQFIKSRENN